MSTKGQGEAVEAGRALGQGRTLGGVQNAKEENDRKEITGEEHSWQRDDRCKALEKGESQACSGNRPLSYAGRS